jgi:mRNA interferase YafQ
MDASGQAGLQIIAIPPSDRSEHETLLPAVLDKLAADQEFDPKLKNHALTGEMAGFRECRPRPDLLIVYTKAEDPPSLIMMRIGSHSELF